MKKLLFFVIAIILAIQGWSQTKISEVFDSKTFPPSEKMILKSQSSKTPCGAINSFPWSDSFDTYGTGTSVFPTCWTRNTTYADRPYVSRTNFSAPGSLFFYSGTAGTYNIAALPPIDSAINVNALKINFKYRNTNSTDTLKIGVMTDPNVESTWIEVGWIKAPTTATWADYEVSLASYQGTGQYIALRIDHKGAIIYAYVDDLVVDSIPSCARPTNISFTNISTTTADISWIPGNSTDIAWWIHYSVSGSNIWDSVFTTTNPTTLSNLTPNTIYEIRMKTDCSVEMSEFSFITQFTTTCLPISALPWTESFDTYGTGTTIFPNCWRRNTTQADSPYVYATNPYSGVGSLYFYSLAATYNIAATPSFDLTIPINTLEANFMLRKSSAAYNITVGVMTDPSDETTFTPIANLSPSTTNTWEPFYVNFNAYTGTGTYIAFKSGPGATNYMQLDDLVIDNIPLCARPHTLGVSNLTSSSADLTWIPGNTTDFAWWMYYRPLGGNHWDSVYSINANYNINNLSPSTAYEVMVKTDCGIGLSPASDIVLFRTSCGAITSIPWYDDFDTYGTGGTIFPTCWTKNSTQTDRPYVNSGGISLPGLLQFYAGSGTYNIAALPQIDNSISINDLRLKFKFRNTNLTDTIKIGVMTVPSDLSTWTEVGYFTTPLQFAWDNAEISLASYTGNGRYIALRVDNGSYGYVDDLELSYIPTCNKPSDIIVSNITANSADVSWTPANPQDFGWKVFFKGVSSLDWDSIYSNVSSCTINQLTPSSTYEVVVSTDCGTEISEPTLPVAFQTLCAPISGLTDLPWNEGFEGINVNNEFPPCWNKIGTKTYTKISTNQARTGSKFVYFDIKAKDTLVTPEFELYAGENYSFVFWYATDGTSDLFKDLKLRVVSKDDTLTNMILGIPVLNPSNTAYRQYIGDFSPSTTGVYEYRIECESDYSGMLIGFDWRLGLDDFSLDKIDCPMPQNVHFTNITSTSIDLAWDSINNGQWMVEYKAGSDAFWNTNIAFTNTYSFTNLLPQTKYDFRVTNLCGTDTSKFVAMSYTTPCTPIDALTSLPWNEGFEGITVNDELPLCWSATNLGTQTHTQISDGTGNNKARTGTKSGYFLYHTVNNSFTTPVFELQAGEIYSFTFWYITHGGSGWEAIQAKVRTYSDNTTSIIGVPVSKPNNSTYQMYIGEFTPSSTGLYEFIIEAESSIGLFIGTLHITIDDIGLDAIKCPMPENLSLNNITPTSLDMTWDLGSSTQWIVGHKLSIDTVWVNNNAVTNSYSFINLLSASDYDFRVASICGQDTSMYIIESTTTPCLPIASLPYTENFDNLGGSGSNYFPDCWSKITTYSKYPYPDATNYSPPYSLYFYATAGNYNLAILHEIDQSIQIDSLMISFWMRKRNATTNCIIGIMDSIDVPSTFTPIDTIAPSTINTWEDFEIYTNTYTGTGRYIAFKSEYNSAVNYFYIDDVYIDYIPTCIKPIHLNASNITTTTADISWTPGNQTDNAWRLYYKEVSSSDYDSVLVNNTPIHTLINLNHSSEYEYYLITDCGNEVSLPSKPESFFTQCSPISSFPWKEGFEDVWINGLGISNEQVPNQCWVNINGGASTAYRWRKNTSTTIPDYVRKGNGAAQLYGSNQSMGDYLMTPVMTFTGNQQLIFWGKGYSNVNRYPEHLWVKAYSVSANGDISSYSDTTLLTNIAFINDTNCYTWNEYEISLANLVGDYRLVFSRDNNIGYYYQLDDLEVDKIPACPRPVSASVSNATQNTAVIAWVNGSSGDNSWKIYYRPINSLVWDSVFTSNNPHSLTGLSASTEYEVGIATDCKTGEYSNLRLTSFRTSCGPITILPWVDNFDSYGTGTSVFPDCWTRNTTYANRPYVTTAGYSAPGCLYFYAATGSYNIAAIPELDKSINVSDLKAEFKFKSNNSRDILYVGVMTDPNNDSTFVLIDSITAPTTGTWYDYTVYFTPYTGNGKYIAFKVEYATGTVYARLDDLEVSYNFVCNVPTSLIANNITINSANISWIAGGTETSWQIKQGESGSIIDLINSTYQAIGLSPNTNYTYYLRSNCGNNLYSSWVSLDFTTQDLPKDPIVETSNITVFTHNTARFTGSYTQGRDAVIGIGFKYKEQSSSNWINESITPVATPFNFDASGLTPNTSYKVIAYATTSAGTFYGDTATFTTNQLLPPNVTTDTVIVDNTDKSAKFEGTTSQGTYAIIARGFEYKISSADWSAAIDLTATGSANITATATSLKVDKYNVRAYAETSEGKTYGGILNFEIVSSLNAIEGNSLEVNLYPNPASNEATLSIKGVNGKASIVITDVQGRAINKFDKEGILGEIKHSLDLSNYAKGVYYIRIQNSNSIKTQKLIVQ